MPGNVSYNFFMIRGLIVAAAVSLTISSTPAAEPEKVQFKQTASAPRELPQKPDPTATAKSGEDATLLNYQATLSEWRSAKKRLHALESVGKILQGDPSADKEIVAMIQLMSIEKDQEVENLRVQLAAILLTSKLEDPALPAQERAQIVSRAAR